MYYAYILKSNKNNKYYIGSTSDLNRRLIEHNSRKVKSTKMYATWSIYYFEEFITERDAKARERQIKSWKSRAMIEKLKFKQNRGPSISQPNQNPDLGEIGASPTP